MYAGYTKCSSGAYCVCRVHNMLLKGAYCVGEHFEDPHSQSRIQKVLSGEGVQKFRLLFFALAILFSHWRGAYHYSKWPSSAHQRTPIPPSCPLDPYMIACLNSLRPIWAYNRLAFVQTVEKIVCFFF